MVVMKQWLELKIRIIEDAKLQRNPARLAKFGNNSHHIHITLTLMLQNLREQLEVSIFVEILMENKLYGVTLSILKQDLSIVILFQF